jgi:hypothetical protein
MKVFLFSLSALLIASLAGVAQVPVGPGSLKLGKVQAAMVKTPEFQITGGQSKRYKVGEWLECEVEFATEPELIDELTFKYMILVEKKLLDGEVTHINIPKGREHYSVVYVAPRSLERLTGGKPLTATAVDNVWVEVSKQGQVLGRTSLKQGAVPNATKLTGLVLNKDQAPPFAPLYYDRYEAIKPSR